jgi:hypothetical protein
MSVGEVTLTVHCPRLTRRLLIHTHTSMFTYRVISYYMVDLPLFCDNIVVHIEDFGEVLRINDEDQ